MPSLVDDGLHGVFSVCKAYVIPLLLTGLKDRLKVSNFIDLGQVQAFCLCQFKLCTPQLDLHLGQLLLRHQPGFFSRLHPLLGSLNSFALLLRRGNHNVRKGLFPFSVLSKFLQSLVKDVSQLRGLTMQQR